MIQHLRRSTGKPQLLSLFLLAAVAAVSARQAHAFETALHEGITHDALAGLGFDSKSEAEIIAGNTLTDRDPAQFNTHAAHFDSEAFADGSARLRAKLDEAMNALENCDRSRALAAIGTSLHAIQDFFAHSNFVELHERDPSAQIDLFHLENPASDLPCWSPGYSPGLTTGYWPNDPAKMREITKCTHDELAKDSPKGSPRWYAAARARAAAESANYFGTFQVALWTKFGGQAAAVERYLKKSVSTQSPGSYCAPGCSAGGVPESTGY
jgi:hypothetical protein